jgi:hypothetical protein
MAASQDNTAVRRGYLTLHRNPGGMFTLSTLSSKRTWMVLCRKGPSGKPRIEMYRSEDSVSGQQPHRMIDLETVRSVQPVERKKGFLVELLDETMMLQCTSKADMEDWVRDINRLRGGRVDLASGQDTQYPAGHDIYEVVPDDETFRVKLRKSSTVNFSGQCLLEIQRDFDRNFFHIALFTESDPPRLIVRWQIDHIRQYGSNNMAFKFQSGSKSSTGVDWFIVDTDSGAAVRIHRSVDYWAKHIVDQIKNTRGIRRAPSIPCPQVPPDRPPRSASSSCSFPIETSSCPANSAYAPLDIHTREQAGVYQAVSIPSGGKKKAVEKQASAGARAESNSTGVYQPLVQPNRDSPSAYAMINPGRVQRGSPTSPTGGGDPTYMGLRADTRQPDNRSNYACPDRK